MVKFDDYWDFADEAPAGDGLPMPEDGIHPGKISRVRVQEFPFMEQFSPKGRSIAIEVEIGGCSSVEAIIPVTFRSKIVAACQSAGVPSPKRGEDWNQEQLLGRRVRVETVRKIPPSGNEYARVERWLPPASPQAAPQVERAVAPQAQAGIGKSRQRPPVDESEDVPF